MCEVQSMEPEKMIPIDNGGRRFGDDRRLYKYYGYYPERRAGVERRTGAERRIKPRLA